MAVVEVRVVDCTGLLCVEVLFRLRSHMAEAPSGTVFHLITDDPAAPLDLAAWCHMTGHTYLGSVAADGGASSVPVYGLTKEAKGVPTAPAHPWRLDD